VWTGLIRIQREREREQWKTPTDVIKSLRVLYKARKFLNHYATLNLSLGKLQLIEKFEYILMQNVAINKHTQIGKFNFQCESPVPSIIEHEANLPNACSFNGLRIKNA
jgi:hypothetical protein